MSKKQQLGDGRVENDPTGGPGRGRVKVKTIPADAVLSLTFLSEITGESGRNIQLIVEQGFIPRPEARGMYNVHKTIRGLLAFYRGKASAKNETLAEDKALEQRANAEVAQLKAAREKRTVVLAKDVEAIWEDGFAKIATCIRGSKIKPEQKKALFDEIMTIKLEPLPDYEE